MNEWEDGKVLCVSFTEETHYKTKKFSTDYAIINVLRQPNLSYIEKALIHKIIAIIWTIYADGMWYLVRLWELSIIAKWKKIQLTLLLIFLFINLRPTEILYDLSILCTILYYYTYIGIYLNINYLFIGIFLLTIVVRPASTLNKL